MGRKVKEVPVRFRVLVEQTGVETVVSKDYYEKYASEGIRFIGVYEEGSEITVTEEVIEKEDSLADKSYDELKDIATIKQLTFPGNISKEKLIELLEE